MEKPFRFSRRQGSAFLPSGPGQSSTGTPTTGTASQSPTTTTSLFLPSTTSTTQTENQNPASGSIIVPIAIVCSVFVFVLVVLYLLRRTRRKHSTPKYIPTAFLKNLWMKWDLKPSHERLPDSRDHLEPVSLSNGLRQPRSSRPPSSFSGLAVANANNTTTGGVDRNTSVRSVMTLPAYHPDPRQNEQVLGREGERGGIDMVVEFPETVDEEEARREEEMEALFQVRSARRRENEEREERRRLRREARDRGDIVALRQLREQQSQASSANAGRTVEELRAELERVKRDRQRTVSSVSYGDLGVARHDGTRLRGNSEESERQGLLGDAASFAASSRYHQRGRSASSVLSIDTMNSDLPSPGITRSRANSRTENSLRRLSSHNLNEATSTSHEGRAGSSPEMIEHDDIPPSSPPGYEHISLDTSQGEEPPQEPPPNYSSPVLARGEGRSALEAVHGRRTSATHVGNLIMDRTSSSSTSGVTSAARSSPSGERRTSRGSVSGPPLPNLRVTSLPSIQVDPGSPVVRRTDEDRHPEE